MQHFLHPFWRPAMNGLALGLMWPLQAQAATRPDEGPDVDAPCDHASLNRLELRANAGHTEAQLHLGGLLVDGVCGTADPDTGLMWITRSARSGHIRAQHELGVLLLLDAADDTDRREGLYWLGLAAGHGDGFSATALGMIHERGMHGVASDVCLALDWYEAGLLLGFDTLADHYRTLLDGWSDTCY